jgi:uridine phosphorylase
MLWLILICKLGLPKENHTTLNIIRVGTSGSMRREIPAGTMLASEYGIGLDTLMAFYNTVFAIWSKKSEGKFRKTWTFIYSLLCKGFKKAA